MAKCQFCDKDVAFGIKVSHSHRRSNRTWKPNVKRVKAIVDLSMFTPAPAACAAARSPALCNLTLPETSPPAETAGFFRGSGRKRGPDRAAAASAAHYQKCTIFFPQNLYIVRKFALREC